MKTESDFHTHNQREHIASLLSDAQQVILSHSGEAQSAARLVEHASLLLRQLVAADTPCAK